MNNQKKAEVLLYILGGGYVSADVAGSALPFAVALAESVVHANGQYRIALWEDGAVYACGDNREGAIREAIVMVANGALFQV